MKNILKNIIKTIKKCSTGKVFITCCNLNTSGDSIYLTLPRFYARIFVSNDECVIQYSVRKYFDRWANSIDFTTNFSINKKHNQPDIIKQYKWMCKVVKSKLFNFSNYFNAINLPFLNASKGRYN